MPPTATSVAPGPQKATTAPTVSTKGGVLFTTLGKPGAAAPAAAPAPTLTTTPQAAAADTSKVPVTGSTTTMPQLEAQEAAETASGATPALTGRTHRPSRRESRMAARASAVDLLADRGGHRDRKSGAFGVPDDDMKEPERTERLLASPFAMCRTRTVDAFASREGFFMFRVNGATALGKSYRVLVIVLNIAFGCLSGLQPWLAPGSLGATAQTAVVGALQLLMATLCFCILPDADRIFSRFAATQFLLEGCATLALLGASVAANQPGGAAAPTWLRTFKLLQDLGFGLALSAMLVPMLQLIEQRLVTPAIGIAYAHGINSPLALLATLYMLAASLPRKVANLVLFVGSHDNIGAASAADAASADAGDDAVEAKYEGNSNNSGGASAGQGAQEGGSSGEGAAAEEGRSGGGASSEEQMGLQTDQVADAGLRVTRLVGRALAAKEAGGKTLNKAPVEEEEELMAGGGDIRGVHALAKFKRLQRRRSQKVDDDGDDADD